MSKFIGYLNSDNFSQNKKFINFSTNSFLKKYKKTRNFNFTSTDGDFSINILKKSDDTINNFYYDQNKKTFTFFSGTPQLGSKLLDAKQIYSIFLSDQNNLFYLDGSWLLGVYFEKTKKIIFFRDYLGAKPFYYSDIKKGFLFSSNINFIANSSAINKKINYEFLHLYLASHPKCAWSRDLTIFKNIKTFSPIYGLELSNYEKKFNFFNKNFFKDKKTNLVQEPNINFFSKKLIEILEENISNYLIPRINNKFCITLSGGIDAGTMAFFLNKITKKKVSAFTAYFSNSSDYDELKNANLIAKKYVGKHFKVKCTSKEMADDLQNIYEIFDTPFCTGSIYGFYVLGKNIKKNNYNTIFTGYGGNYINSGVYPSYMYNLADLKNSDLYNYELKKWIKLHNNKLYPKSEKTLNFFLKDHINPKVKGKIYDKIFWLDKKEIINNNFHKSNVRKNTDILNLGSYLDSSILFSLFYDSIAPACDNEDWIDWDLNLETVNPLTNKNLIKYGLDLPNKLKINHGINRILVRNTLKGILPNNVVDDYNTMGFKLPTDDWFANDLKDFFMDIILSKKFRERGIYNLKIFDNVVKEHMTKKKNHMLLMWQALNFELWALKWKPEF
jgi:asparagine synthase (glutamine-hydrolysing)